MADLPTESVTPAPTFTYTRMEVFGLFYIKEGRKGLERWGLLFTCVSSAAEEKSESLDATRERTR